MIREHFIEDNQHRIERLQADFACRHCDKLRRDERGKAKPRDCERCAALSMLREVRREPIKTARAPL